MALYEYECQACGNRVEVFKEMAERDSPARCAMPGCGGELRRTLSNPAIQFHGAGFTRQPSVMREKVAAGSPMHGTNWGMTTSSELGAGALEDE
jgi:putative FmdB family regulatory protein